MMLQYPSQPQQHTCSRCSDTMSHRKRPGTLGNDLACLTAVGGFTLGASAVFMAMNQPLTLSECVFLLGLVFLLALALFSACQWIVAHIWGDQRIRVATAQIEACMRGAERQQEERITRAFPISPQMHHNFLAARRDQSFLTGTDWACPLGAHLQAMGHSPWEIDIQAEELWLAGATLPLPAWVRTYEDYLSMRSYDEPDHVVSGAHALACLARACKQHDITLADL